MSFPGKYRAQVKDVNDPKKLNRVKLYVPTVYGDDTSDWAYPTDKFAWVPVVGDRVWSEFVGGDPNKPLYGGRWWAAPAGVSELFDDVKSGYPNVRMIDSPDGSKIVMDAENKTIVIAHSGGKASIQFDSDGNIIVSNDKNITIDANGSNSEITETAAKKLNMETTDATNGEAEIKTGKKLNLETQAPTSQIIIKTGAVGDIQLDAQNGFIHLKANGSGGWVPNCFPACLLTGVPHGGTTGTPPIPGLLGV